MKPSRDVMAAKLAYARSLFQDNPAMSIQAAREAVLARFVKLPKAMRGFKPATLRKVRDDVVGGGAAGKVKAKTKLAGVPKLKPATTKAQPLVRHRDPSSPLHAAAGLVVVPVVNQAEGDVVVALLHRLNNALALGLKVEARGPDYLLVRATSKTSTS